MMAIPRAGNSATEALPAPTPLQSLAFGSFWLFNVAYYSRVFELAFSSLHIPLILGMVALLGSVVGGGILRTLRTTIGMCMLALTALYAANVPFSSWRTGSLQVFTESWLKSGLAFLIAASVVVTLRHCRWAMYSIATGTALGAVLVSWKGTMVYGRLTMAWGTFGNSNEIAFSLLLGLPLLGLMFIDPHAGSFRKLLIGAAIIITLLVLVQTGSRGGLIGLAVVGFFAFRAVSLPGKIMMVLAVGVLIAVAGALLSGSLRDRYATIFSDDAATGDDLRSAEDARTLQLATSSSQARRALFLRSLKVTMEHPLLGCGIGQFGAYTAGLDYAAGMRADWMGTHNTYTQVSSEAGIPALIVFLVLIVSCFRSLGACYRRAARIQTTRAGDIANMAYALRTSLWAYAICAAFAHVAYDPTLPVMAGLTVGIVGIAQSELACAEREMAEKGAPSVAGTGARQAPLSAIGPAGRSRPATGV